ncbi:hypothetical protein HVX64_23490 (plasmid) [Citrobacter sp. RHB20-C16]|uniref:Uncharacterized protein n=1 Tax=Citrobacter amalonaticus TaxID=35703 RepID=A0ABY0HUY4_CITAM|nr:MULTISPECIES: hypothetical protein [Citrobacter]MZK91441.1 hypothetical protein [Citrobacter amalonaticus]MZK95997.1 hypothetical protein [Citrobacter amalonaticus]MZL05735.1 hypothetical protein [Citrobacter amalonaticus]MZL25766.1 hypothetical protein [Citrobacter amalonaticus]MZL43675.1 hypothetical protein [Citrobacter amalonaticus]
MLDKDLTSKILSQIMNILFLGYPLRTALGFLIGALFWCILHIFTPLMQIKGFVVDWVYEVGCFVLGVLGMNVKTVAEAYKGDAISEKFGNTLRLIDKRQDLSPEQKRLLIIQLLNDHISKLSEKQVQEVEKRVIEK